MSAAGIIALVVGLLFLLVVAGLVACYFVREQRAERLRRSRQWVVIDAEQKLRDSTHQTLRAMNEAIRDQYRQ